MRRKEAVVRRSGRSLREWDTEGDRGREARPSRGARLSGPEYPLQRGGCPARISRLRPVRACLVAASADLPSQRACGKAPRASRGTRSEVDGIDEGCVADILYIRSSDPRAPAPSRLAAEDVQRGSIRSRGARRRSLAAGLVLVRRTRRLGQPAAERTKGQLGGSRSGALLACKASPRSLLTCTVPTCEFARPPPT